jgi:phosphoribosylglycinamide formyltransferase-1
MTIRLAVLVSGRGSNLQALLDAIAAGALDAQVVGVFSDRVQAPALAKVAPAQRCSHFMPLTASKYCGDCTMPVLRSTK